MVVAGGGDHPRDGPDLGGGGGRGGDAVKKTVAVGIDEGSLLVAVPDPVRVGIREGFPKIVLAVPVGIDIRLSPIETAVEIRVRIGFVENVDGWVAG